MHLTQACRKRLVILLLLVTAVGWYLYHPIGNILEDQLQKGLQRFGVEAYQLDRLHFGIDTVSADRLLLRGHLWGHNLKASLLSPVITFDWRTFLTGKLRSVRVAQFTVSITEAGVAPKKTATTHTDLSVDELVPAKLMGRLPVRSLQIDALQADYRGEPPFSDLHLSGALSYQQTLSLSLSGMLDDSPISLQLHAAGNAASLAGSLGGAGLSIPDIIEEGKGSGRASLNFANGQLKVQLDTLLASGKFTFDTPPLDLGTRRWLQWGNRVPVKVNLADPLHITFDGDQWTGTVQNASIALGNDQSEIALQALQLHTTMAGTQPDKTRVEISTKVASTLRGHPLPPVKLFVEQEGPYENSTVHLSLLTPSDSLEVALSGQLNLQKMHGDLQLSAQSSDLRALTESIGQPLRKLGILGAPLLIDAGTFEIHSLLTGIDHWTQSSRVEIAGVSGQYGDYRFSGFSLVGAWQGLENLRTTEPVIINLEHLDIGTDVSEVSSSFTLPQPTSLTTPNIAIGSFSAMLFGGRVFLPETATWDFGANHNALTLRAQDWQLARIVALQHGTDIQADGRLEGALPIKITDGRVIIHNGYLRALPPGGTIRYMPNESSHNLRDSSSELDLALNLLRDFHYEILNSTVELDKSGKLLLSLSLAGNNPNQHGGQSVNFNINVEQNIDPLLQSLLLSGKLIDNIENRLQ
ncbi:MAG: YdbH domain-containing protein [Halioglobus sp.]|nr:YdbH domain-containing protein [Halioglobus sp.]